jgi:hypothetical protein
MRSGCASVVSVRERLVALQGSNLPVPFELDGGRLVVVRIATVGGDWLGGDLVDGTSRRSQCVLPIDAIAGINLDSQRAQGSLDPLDTSDPPENGRAGFTARFGLAFVLRDLCRRRSALDLLTVDGTLHGTIDRVGRDHLDLAVHDSDTPRRQAEVRAIRIVPFARVRLVRL